MRVRNKKNAMRRIAALDELLINDLEKLSPPSPLYIEIGCGKGTFIAETAKRLPYVHFLAVEKVPSVLVTAMERTAREEIPNISFFLGDAADLAKIPEEGFCSRIYLNFSDPWPKKRHTKRRLTSPGFLELYKKILSPGGEIHFKTDNREFFDYSVESFGQNGFILENVTYDLHNSEFMKDNIMTEYERLFSSLGLPICRLEAVFRP